jgi:hypothetical protein
MAAQLRTNPQQGIRFLAAGLLAGALLASADAQAAGAGAAAERIKSAFDLVSQTPSAPTEPFIIHAMERAQEERGPDAALPADKIDPTLSAFGPRPSTSLQTGVFSKVLAPTPKIVQARLPRPRPDVPAAFVEPAVTGSVAPAAVETPSAVLQEAHYFGRFDGSFSGGGAVKRNARASANQVKCDLEGQAFANGVTISGKCGVAFISREVRADIRFDPASGTYTGTYIGSDVGPARLWGKRQGDQVVLTITWPKPVNGDTKATMTIHNSGNGRLAITVVDAVQPGGPQAEVTRLALSEI